MAGVVVTALGSTSAKATSGVAMKAMPTAATAAAPYTCLVHDFPFASSDA
jgi:hypothetical protein